MNPATLERLEFPQLKELLWARLTCAPGRRALEALAPSNDRNWIEAELESVAEARLFLAEGQEMGLSGLADPAPLLAKLGVGDVVLDPPELLELATLLSLSTSTRRELGAPRFRQKLPRLRELAADLTDFSALERDIRRRILPGGEIDTYASPDLADLRNQIQKTEQKLHRSLKRVLEQAAAQAALQDEFVTLRGGRLVLPIRSDARSRPDGVVHAVSGTGQTLFLEPLETIALNNELVRLREEEAAEIRRILLDLTQRLARNRETLERATSTLGRIDSFFARARFARDFGCTLPQFDSQQGLRLTSVRHPLLEAARENNSTPAPPGRTPESRGTHPHGLNGAGRQAEHNREVVPISLRLDAQQRVLVISGPNAGGKTVALKTLGLAVLAAQAGIPVPAAEAVLPVFEQVLADIGDEQSLVENLSTFSGHILNLRGMVEQAKAGSLVLLDELGAATSPEEGAALGVALLEHFRQCGAVTVATTHHERLKAYAASTPGALNAAVEFDEANLRPTYRLLLGVPGASSGIDMAARLGLPPGIIEGARSKLSAEATETAALIRSLHQTQQELERLQAEVRKELERLQQEREALQREWIKEQRKKLAELERTLQALLAEHKKEMRGVVDALRAGPKAREKLEKAGARQLSKAEAQMRQEFDAAVVTHLGETTPPAAPRRVDPEQLIPGARVKLRGIARRGVVLSKLDASTVDVQIGSLRMRARAEDVETVEEAATPRSSLKLETARATDARRDFARGKRSGQGGGLLDLDLRGMRVEEALEKTDKFLDEAVLAGHGEVRIIHGVGSGALKKALREFLAEHPHVETTREGDRERGGSGATIVLFKRN